MIERDSITASPAVSEDEAVEHAPAPVPETEPIESEMPYATGGVYALMPVAVVCDSCLCSQEYKYALDLGVLSRKTNGLDRKTVAKVRADVLESAGEDRWLRIGGRVYCPSCAESIEAGELKVARSGSVTAGELVTDLYTAIKAKRMERG